MNTKVDIISGAYSKIRISGLTVLPSAEDLELALVRLENMMSELQETRSICLGYNFEDEPDPNSVTNIPSWAIDGIGSSLAIRLIPDFNKAVPQQLMSMAVGSLSSISGRVARDRLNQVNYPDRMPIGSGNTLYNRWYRFYRSPINPPNTCDTNTINVGDINNYTEHYDSWLEDNEAILSYTIEWSSKITVTSDAQVGNDIDYVVRGDNASNWETVTIQVTSDLGRILTRVINFVVVEQITAN